MWISLLYKFINYWKTNTNFHLGFSLQGVHKFFSSNPSPDLTPSNWQQLHLSLKCWNEWMLNFVAVSYSLEQLITGLSEKNWIKKAWFISKIIQKSRLFLGLLEGLADFSYFGVFSNLQSPPSLLLDIYFFLFKTNRNSQNLAKRSKNPNFQRFSFSSLFFQQPSPYPVYS